LILLSDLDLTMTLRYVRFLHVYKARTYNGIMHLSEICTDLLQRQGYNDVTVLYP